MKIFLIAGTRPNYVKVAALWRAYQSFKRSIPSSKLMVRLINTGQHYDYLMSKKMFLDFKLPPPYKNLEVGSSSHGAQTAKIMERFEALLLRERPDLVMVVGDVNSTMACSLVAAKMQIPLAHVEAGLRSRDRSMPEEINRIVTDILSDFLFTTCRDANRNLEQEGIAKEKIFFVGNVMVDTLLANLPRARQSVIRKTLGLKRPYVVLTLHRPSNVDRESKLGEMIDALERIQDRCQIVFPVHPRTAKQLKKGPIRHRISSLKNLYLIPPLGYLDFINLLDGASLVLTDSGGIQEETTVLKVPCLTLRPNTERPVTMKQGSNILVGQDGDVASLALRILDKKIKRRPCLRRPERWDGKAAERIFKVLVKNPASKISRI